MIQPWKLVLLLCVPTLVSVAMESNTAFTGKVNSNNQAYNNAVSDKAKLLTATAVAKLSATATPKINFTATTSPSKTSPTPSPTPSYTPGK